jgi:hypothetical protein
MEEKIINLKKPEKFVDLRNRKPEETKRPPAVQQEKPALSKPKIALASAAPALNIPKPAASPVAATPRTEPTETKSQLLNKIFEWEAREFEKIPKTKEWFWAGGILSAAFLTVAIIQKNLLFAIVIVLASFVVYLYALKEPRVVSFAITSRGVKIGNRLYEFDDLESFWIFYEPPRIKELSIESKKTLMPRLEAPLGDADPVKLREALIRFLPEKKHEEDIASIIARRIGF